MNNNKKRLAIALIIFFSVVNTKYTSETFPKI